MRTTALTLILATACVTERDSAEPSNAAGDAVWEELSEDDIFGGDDTDKPDGDACGEEVVEGEPCEGDWTVTLCVDEHGEWWWCEGGVWTSDKDT
jgi:hypothetical protein